MAFLKQASLKIENPDVEVNSWVGNRGNVKTATNKMVEYKKIIADFHPDNYLLTHCTIVASVDVEKAPKPVHFGSEKTKREYEQLEGCSEYYITPQTSKYMNANGDAWSRELLKKSYRTFIGAENYVEHVQDPALSKGKILDAVAREVDDNRSIFVDILVATNKKHSDLVNKIKTGELQTLSMGAIVAFTICSQCGRVATDETELCHHIKFLKKNSFISEHDGKKRITAELCGHYLYPESNKFIEGSWVETPAFKGAVMRNQVDVDQVDKIGFHESIEPVLANLNISDPEMAKTASRIFKAFQIVDNVKKSFGPEAKTEDTDEEPVEDTPTEDTEEEAPVEEPADEEETKDEAPVEKEEETEDAPAEEEAPADEGGDEEAPAEEESEPVEDQPVDDLPEELGDMGEDEGDAPSEEAPKEEDDPALEEEAKKPYDVLKKEIKQQLKDQIKQELLKDLGIEVDEVKPPNTSLDNVNLNETLVRSSLNRIKSACIMAKEVGLKNLTKHGYTTKEVVKIAELSGKYSINKDMFNIVGGLEINKYPTFRRIAKKVESELGRELKIAERVELDILIKDLFK